MESKLSAMNTAQKNLINVEKLSSEKGINNINGILTLPERTSVKKITEALNHLLGKIECLNLEVLPNEQQYIQPFTGLSKINHAIYDNEKDYKKAIEDWKSEPIFNYQEPLYHFRLFSSPVGKKELLIKFHHLISDLYTLTEFVNTLATYLLDETEVAVEKYHNHLEGAQKQLKVEQFWKNTFHNFEGKELYQSKKDKYKTRKIRIDFTKKFLSTVEKATITNNMSLYECLLAAVLYTKKVMTMSAQSSIGIATGRKNKKWLGSETKVLPLVHNFERTDTVSLYLEKIHNQCNEIEVNSDYTMSQIASEVCDTSIDSLIDISCIELNQSAEKEALQELDFAVMDCGSKHNPLTIKLIINDNRVLIEYEYQRAILNSNNVKQFHDILLNIMTEMLHSEAKDTLADISLLQDKERRKIEKHQLILPLKQKNIVEAFKEQVISTPQKTAICFQESELSFQELDSKSDSLASRLIEQGIKDQDIVGTSLTGINAIIGIFAILKVGAIYLPIDSKLTENRINYILQDSSCRLLLAEEKQEALSIPVHLFSHEELEENKFEPAIASESTPEKVAYIIYTSGSTGLPKGVMVSHIGVINMCSAFKHVIGINEKDVIQQFASHSFDASILEIFGGLLSGCQIVMVDEQTKQDPQKLQDLWDKRQVSFAIIPPVYMKNLDADRKTPLNYLMTAGEEANWNFLNVWKDKLTYINAYGPSEATVWTTTWLYDMTEKSIKVPIGKPIPNMKCSIFQNEQECGFYMQGELYISGTSLSAGYMNNREKTKESFIQHPITGELMYRTGDIAYWQADGQLVFVGRNDAQVKVRGHRIELGDVNAAILRIPGVIESYTCLIGDTVNEKELVVYLVLESTAELAAITNELRNQLPSYMHPHHIVQVNALPMTLNGKVDRTKLPEVSKKTGDSLLYSLTDKVEIDIVVVFEQLLKTKITEDYYDFYSLGGDSIKAIRIVSRLRNQGYEIESIDLIDSKSIKKLAEKLKNDRSKGKNTVSTLKNEARKLSQIQKEFFKKDFLVKDHFNQCFTLFTEKSIEPEQAKQLFYEISQQHEQLSINFNTLNQPFVNEDRERLKFETAHYKGDSKTEFAGQFRQACSKAQESFDISTTPLFNVIHFNTKWGTYLFMVMHHLIVDGVSWRVLIEELEASYQAMQTGQSVNVEKEGISFNDWVYQLEEYSQKSLKKEMDYWETKNSEIQAVEQGQSTFGSTKIAAEKLILTEEISQHLFNGVSQNINCSITDLFVTALSNSMENDKVSIMLESHGREAIAKGIRNDKMLGWFTTYYPVVLNRDTDLEKMLLNTSKELKSVPNSGLNYLAYKNHKSENLESVFEPKIIFNYLGDLQNLADQFTIETLDSGSRNSKANALWFPLTITGKYSNNQIEFELQFDQTQFSKQFVQKLCQQFVKTIEKLVHICLTSPKEQLLFEQEEHGWDQSEYKQACEQAAHQSVEIEKIYPLSQMQENFLFNKMFQKEDDYVVQVAMTIHQTLSNEKVTRALQQLAQCYEVLRTAIYYKKYSIARNVQYQQREVPCTFDDMSGFEKGVQETFLSSFLEHERMESWDFETTPLFRAHVIKKSETESTLIWSFHHILMDGWCLNTINETFMKLYNDECSIEDIKKNQVQYSEYINELNKKDQEESLLFWKNYLTNFESKELLIPEKPSYVEKQQQNSMQEIEIQLPNELFKQIQNLSKNTKVSVGTILECGWGLILQNYSMSEDVVFGKIAAGRNYPLRKIDEMVGLFINTIPVRVRSNSELTFRQLLHYQQRSSLLTEQYQEISLSDINSLLDQKIATLFSYDVFKDSHPELLTHEHTYERTNYDLNLAAIQKEQLCLKVMYNAEKFEESTLIYLLKRYEYLLRQCSENANIQMKQLELIVPEEKERIVKQFSQNSHVDILTSQNIVEVFQEKAFLIPDQVAVKYEDQTITYRELDLATTKVANYLKKIGVKPKDKVISILDRGIKAVISFIGILKARGIYVPIDSKGPKERMEYILNDSAGKYVLTTAKVQSSFGLLDENKALTTLHVEAILSDEEAELEQNNSSFAAYEPAYMIYTSGSTGKPKGVLISHGSAVNMALGMHREFEFKDGVEVLQQFASLAFDASILEILTALLNGHRSVIIPEGKKLNPQDVVSIWNKEGVTWAVLPPIFVNEIEVADVHTLKYLKTAGEESNWAMVEKWRNKVKYANGYGPTEATVWSTTWFATGKNKKQTRSVPIGKPAPNVKCYVLQDNKLCGIGLVGELCILGQGVGLEYHNRAGLTAEKFPDYLNEKMYRTGDYVRWLEDGSLEFLGRKDNQYKIRGNRVELGEIASKIKELEAVKDAVVLVKDHNGDKEIYAYTVTDGLISNEAIKQHIRSTLPSYMIPCAFSQIEKIPTTLNGKVDQKKLLNLEISHSVEQTAEELTKQQVTEANETNLSIYQEVQHLFNEILGNQKVAYNENFFDVGGHSVKAARLVNRLNKKYLAEIELNQFFENPTINFVVAFLLKQGKAYEEEVNEGTAIPVIKETDHLREQRKISATATQKRLYALQLIDPESTAYNMPSLFKVNGVIDENKLEESFKHVSNHFNILNMNFELKDDDVLLKRNQHVRKVEILECEEQSLLNMFYENIKPFDIEGESLVRLKVFKTNENCYLFIDVHHSVCDGHSTMLFVEELLRSYQQERPLKIEMTFEQLNEKINQEDVDKAEKYWEKTFKKEVEVLNLPLDHPRVSRIENTGKEIVKHISTDLRAEITAYCRKHNLTMYMFFVTATIIYLHQLTKQEEIVIGTPFNTRIYEHSENVFGMYANTLPLKGLVSTQKSFLDISKEMKEQIISVFENQAYPLDKIIDINQSNKDYARNPLFDVFLAFNQYEMKLETQKISLEKVSIPTKTAPFDLTLDFLDINNHLTMRWEYKTSIFEESSIQKMMTEYFDIILSVVSTKKEKSAAISTEVKKLFSTILNQKADFTKSFLEQGGDSIKAIRLSSKLKNEGINITSNEILKCQKLSELFYTEPKESGEQEIIAILKSGLDTKTFDLDKGFLEQGGDSIKAIRIATKLREKGINIEANDLLKTTSLRKLIVVGEEIEQQTPVIEKAKEFPVVSPIIETFFEQKLANSDFFNQSVLLELDSDSCYEEIKTIFDELTAHHSIFKENFLENSKGKSRITQVERPTYEIMNYNNAERQVGTEEFIVSICESIQRSFSIESSPLLKVAYMDVEDKKLLFICAHHLIIDGFSWRILLDDFILLQKQAKAEEKFRLPCQTLSYKIWLSEMNRYARKTEVLAEKEYWEQVENLIPDSLVYEKTAMPSVLESNTFKQASITIDETILEKLQSLCNPEQDIQINDILLTALAYGIGQMTGQERFSFNLEGHGRQTIDPQLRVDRTIGWFTTIYPVVLDTKRDGIEALLFNTCSTLRAIPNNGFGYGILKYCSKELEGGAIPNCSFNFMGNMSMSTDEIKFSDYETGATMDEANNLWSPLNYNGVIQNRVLQFNVDYDASYFNHQFIESLNLEFKKALYLLVDRQMEEEYPLTPTQEGLLFQKLNDDESKAYSTQTIFEVIGRKPKIDSLKKAISAISLKHSALTLRIDKELQQEGYVQYLEHNPIEIREYNYSNDVRTTEEIVKLVSAFELDRKFVLEEGNLFRVSLIYAPEGQLFLLFNFHHVVFDGWSLSNLLMTISEVYQMYLNGEDEKATSYLHDTDHYKSFLMYIKNGNEEEEKKYWQNLLSDYSHQTDFKLLETQVKTDETNQLERLTLPQHLYSKIGQLSAQISVTKNTIMEVIWGLALQKYNYTEDVVFGKVVSGRNHSVEKIEDIVGMLINTIPVRICSQNDETITALIQRVQEQSYSSQPYHRSSLSEIQKWSKTVGSLVSTIYTYSNFVVENQVFPISEETQLKIYGGTEQVNYDVACSIYDNSSSSTIQLSYNASKFKAATIKNILKTMENILEHICIYPTGKVSDIQVLNQAQQTNLYDENESNRKELVSEIVPFEIKKNAKINPQKTAIRFRDQSITYQELDEMSNGLANILLARGIKVEDKIGIYMEKTPLAIISMLGVMKAGACCVTVDRSTPLKRLSYLLKDAEAKILLTDQETLVKDIQTINPKQVRLTEQMEQPNIDISKHNLAYVLYTSGSTGNPKGSLIEYMGLINLFDYIKNKYQINSEAKVLQYASLSFDASVLEIFGALTNNAELIMVPEELRKSPEEIVEVIQKENVTFALIPPAMMNYFNPEDIPSVKFMMNAGEEASPEIAKLWSQSTTYINGYGPSEATIWTTDWNAYKLQTSIRKCPIGKAIPNVNVHILNGSVPVGSEMPGELCISGISLSRGYLNRPELNKTAFFENKMIAPSKIYRTGDLVRRLEDGEIEYLGRIDHQVKVRGHRIELLEVEKALEQLPTINKAICCVVNNAQGVKNLIGYLVTNEKVDYSAIRTELMKNLPRYMVPDRIVEVETIPITTTGKVDRAQLAQIEIVSYEKNLKEKMTPEEQIISEIFKESLDLEAVSFNQSFLDIGGDSISAIKVAAKCRKKDFEVSIKDLLDGKTIKELSERKINLEPNKTLTETKAPQQVESVTSKIRYKENITYKVPITTYKGTEMQSWIYNQPSTVSGAVLALEGDYSDEDIVNALQKVIQNNGVLRSSYQVVKGELIIREYDFDPDWHICLKSLENHNQADIEKIYQREQDRFDCNEIFQSKELASELIVYKEQEGHYKVYLRIHHIFWDAKSAEIFEEQVKQILNDPKQALEKQPTYKDYVEMLQVNMATDATLIHYHDDLEMKEFNQNCERYMQYRETRQSDSISTITVKVDESNLYSNLWGMLGKIIISYEKHFSSNQTHKQKLPAFILYHGRSGKGEKYKGTMGMFLELVPILLESQSLHLIDTSLKSQIEKYKMFKSEIGISFLDYLKMIDNNLDKEKLFEHLPVLNFLGIYDFLDGDKELSTIESRDLSKSTSNHALIVSINHQQIEISMYTDKNVAQEIKTDINKEIKTMEV